MIETRTQNFTDRGQLYMIEYIVNIDSMQVTRGREFKVMISYPTAFSMGSAAPAGVPMGFNVSQGVPGTVNIPAMVHLSPHQLTFTQWSKFEERVRAGLLEERIVDGASK